MIRGLVQGVGFRPFIYRLATARGLHGEVANRSDGVAVTLDCEESIAERFASDIPVMAPQAAMIRSIEVTKREVGRYEDFSILSSRDIDDNITEVSPDIAVCDECLHDIDSDINRIDYPFVNCTSCGPRFSIISSLPYDRINTSMAPFAMCDNCTAEYNDISDRRFHAQPVACNKCGPVYTMSIDGQEIRGINSILEQVAVRLSAGLSVAIKSTGGYNLMCDALSEEAVSGLRQRKQRDRKPFAVMFRDLSAVKEYCAVSEEEEAALLSWRRPVVILESIKPLAPSVSSGLRTVGAMLPHMPVHHMLFRMITMPAIVLTSGNLSHEPVIKDDTVASIDLMKVTGCVVSYNREINNRIDDSVVRIMDGRTAIIRRARGYAPQPVGLDRNAEGIFAAGAEMKNSLCIGKGSQALPSQYIGDMYNPATYDFYLETFRLYSSLFRFTPSSVACDMHPDYLSSRFAGELSRERGLPLTRIQHHHAHAASVIAEHNLADPVIGVIMDGTGYGLDGNIWGSEFLVTTPGGFERYSHFDYIKMPGGDAAVREPWRMALSCIHKYLGAGYDFRSLRPFRKIDERKLSAVSGSIENGINAPLTCGAGRFFDAVSALLMLCPERVYDSEAPMLLESAINMDYDDYYPFTAGETVDVGDMFREIARELDHPDSSVIAVKFHNTIARIIMEVCKLIRKDTGIRTAVLSGGVFQNRFLLGKTAALLAGNGFKIYTNQQVPANDGGISLGQLLLVAERRSLCV
jgi:hydrogenase maturation protein HypF